MLTWFARQPAVLQSLLATLFTWFLTALGAGMVFFFKTINKNVLNAMLGFASGVMIAASYWSLLAPALEMGEAQAALTGGIPWLPAVLGFLAGGLFLFILDKTLPHLHPSAQDGKPEGIKASWRRSLLLVLAITIHNFPEGLAVGVAIAGAAETLGSGGLVGALTLALGIGIQNFPEGAAVSIPLRREKMSRRSSFLIGQASG
ncbi:MAG: ZIP family metal transporter, partial [Spirochaetales bacterium]|nr:ZIP family metal transporter [Spirochaetales bacterium]